MAKRRQDESAKRAARPAGQPAAREAPAAGAGAAYDRHRDAAAGRSERQSAAGRDIGPTPEIVDVPRREKCRTSLRLFCETYNRATFHLGWSQDQLTTMERLEEAVLLGALYARAMPRGGGKTSLCRMATLWGSSYGYIRYAFLIGANQEKADDSLEAIKTWVRFLPEYGRDFPEIVHAVRRINGIAQRAAGQHSGGVATMMEWGQQRIILPTVRPPPNWPAAWPLRPDGMAPTSGAVIGAAGLTSEGIRGSLLTLTTGESIRPDLVLLDDPQTHESARSPSQCDKREQLISADVLGMAGPGRTLSAVMPCTVVVPGDLADRFLNRAKHPRWRGQRTKLLPSMPKNLAAWDRYFEVYRDCLLAEPPDMAAANAHYLAHRAELDNGAEASWPERKLDSEVSAVQHAMHLYFGDRRAFMAEYQNDPQPEEEDRPPLVADELVRRVNRVPRLLVPASCSRLTAFADIQQTLLYYLVVAWAEDFTGAVVDYGTWPGQKQPYFTLKDARYTLPLATKVAGVEAQIHAGLTALAAKLLDRDWKREDGVRLRVERCLIDANWHTDLVHGFCKSSPAGAIVLPSRGRFYGATERPIGERKLRRDLGERRGLNWVLERSEKHAARQLSWDTNFWKTFVLARLTMPAGAAAGIMLFGEDGGAHRMLADHCCAEYSVQTESKARKVEVWKLKPGRPDNHLWDCLVGAAVAASLQGVQLAALPEARPASGPAADWAEQQRRYREERESRARDEGGEW